MKTLRVTNVPLSVDQAALQDLFAGAGASPDSLSLAVDGESTQTATISLLDDKAVKRAKKLNRTRLGTAEQLRIEVDDRFDGITTLFNGTAMGEGHKLDIVAIHGLNGHAFKTFRSKEAGVMWLRDFLPKDFPQSRIMTYGYNANVFTNTSTAKIADFRQALLLSLERVRRTEEEKARPILFIAHSLGGIVLKAALTISIRGLEPILPRTCGIVFLGTPHCGSDSAKLAGVLVDIGTIAKRSTMMSSFRNDLIKSLKSNSPEFADISERFAQASFPKGFSIISCHEMKETRPPGRLIVSKNSAIIGFPGNIELTLPFLNSDHHEICKFESPAKPEYGDIMRFLKKALQSFTEGEGQSGASVVTSLKQIEDHLQSIDELQSQRVESSNKDLIRSIWKWLSPYDFSTLRRELRRTDGTCEWFVRSEAYRDWLGSISPLLWLEGIPGSGKSVLASFLTEQLRSKATVLSFFCRSGEPILTKPLSILCNLLAQLLDNVHLSAYHPAILADIEPVFDKYPNRSNISLDLLWKTFNAVVTVVGPLYIVIDGLDECDNDQGDLEYLVDQLQELGETSDARVRILITSRTGYSGSSQRSKWVTTQIHSNDVEEDILLAIGDMIDTEPKLQGLQREILDAVTAHAGGMFLWAKIFLESLKIASTRNLMLEKLENPPIGLDKLYIDILTHMDEKLTSDQRLLRQSVFAWVTGALEPLKLEELSTALSVRYGEYSLNEDHVLIEPKNEIIRVCGPLVQFMDDKSLQLVHKSFRDFIKGTNWDESWNFLPKSQASKHGTSTLNDNFINETIAVTCLSYLSLACFKNLWVHANDTESWSTTYPLLPYAAEYWITHITKVTEPRDRLVEMVTTYCSSSGIVDWFYILDSSPKSSAEDLDDSERVLYDWLSKFTLDAEKSLKPDFNSDAHWTAVNALGSGESIDPVFKIGLYAQLAWLFVLRNRWNEGGKVAQAYARTKDGNMIQKPLLRQRSYHNEIIAQPSEDSKDGNLPTVSESLQWLDLLFSKHLELVKEDFGDEHWLNVLTVNRICRIYASQGRMRKARNILGPFWNLAATDPRFEDPDKLHRWASLLTLYFPHHTDDQAFGPGLEIWKRMQKLYGRNNRDTLRYGWHLANGLLEAGNVSSGLPMLESITKGLTESLGEENRETLNCKSRLASIYASRGQFVNAERLSMAVYETQQRLLGVYHKDTVCTALRRAKLYLFEERVAAAEPMLKDVAEYLRQVENHDSEIFLEYHLLASFLEETKGNLDGSERSLERGVRECTSVCGDIHPVTLIVRWVLIALRARNGSSENIEHINDYLILLERANQSDLHFYVEAQRLLARVYMKQGRFEDAEKVLNLQLERLKSHDAQNTGLVSVYCDLSMVYKSQSRFQDAEATLLMAIEQSTRRSNDIDMLQRGLAEVYESMGRLEDAQIQTSRAWQFCKSEFGISHSGTILAASQLARLLQLNGDEAAAKELWTEIWTCRDPSRTKSSTTIRNAAGSLISQYETKEQYDEACEIGYQLWDYITTMSESSNNTALIKLRSAYKLGRLSRLAGRLDDGETLLKQAWPGLQQELGQENPESLQAGSELSQVFVALGRFKDGDELAREILSIQETALGNTNADTMISYENLATWNSERGLIDEAIVFQRKLLDSCTGGDGEYAYALDPLRSKFRLAKLYQEQPGSTQQALEMMEEVYTDLKDHFGETNEDTLTTACNIADLLLGMEGEGPKCLRYAEISYEGRKLVYGPVNENTVLSELYVGMALEHNNELQKSISLIQEFLDNAKQQLPPYQKYELRAFLALSVAYSHDDREEDAKTLIEECFTLCKQASKSYILDAIPDITHLGVQLAALDMFEPAMEMFTLIFNTYIEDSAEIPSSSARVDAQIISDVLVNIPYWKGLAELWASSGTTALSTLWCTCTRQKMETLLESKPLVGLAVLRDLFRCNDAADTDRIAAFTQALGLDFLASLVERTLDNPEIRESETRDVRKSIGGLAFSLYGVGLYASAEKAYTQTLELAKKTLGESHNDTLMALRNLGKCLMLQQKWEECTQRNSELLYLRDTIPDTADKDLMEIISDLASALAILGKFDQTTVFQRNYDMSVNIYGQRDGTTRDAAGMLINSLFSTEQYKPAYEICSMMLDSEKNLVDKVDNAVVLWMSWLCLLSHFVEESDKPDEIFQKTLTVVRQVGVNRVGLQLYPFILRAKVLEMTGRIDEAVDMLTEVLSLGELDDGAEVDTEIEAFALQIWKDELEKYRQLKEQRSRGVFQRIAQMDCDPSAVLKSPLTPLALAAASVVAIIYIRRWTQQQ